MRWSIWALVLVIAAVPGASASAEPVCGLGVCWDGKFEPSRPSGGGSGPSSSSDTARGDGAPKRPPPPGWSDVQRRRWASDLYRQGHRAAARHKLDEAIRHFEKAAKLGSVKAWTALAGVQHKKAVALFKGGEPLAARRLLEQAIRNDTLSTLYPRKLEVFNKRWCAANKPLIPWDYRAESADFIENARAICQAKAQRAAADGWQCDWFTECFGGW